MESASPLAARLAELFTGDELSRFLDAQGWVEVVDHVSWSGALAAVAHETAGQLLRRGLVDQALFEQLIRARPGRRTNIADTASKYGVELGVVRNVGPPPRRVDLTDRAVRVAWRRWLVAQHPDPARAKMLAGDAGLATGSMDWSGAADLVWDRVIVEAAKRDREGLEALRAVTGPTDARILLEV